MAKPKKKPRKHDGHEVRHAVRPMRIDITANDIKRGKPLDPTQCAAAQCLLRTTEAKAVKVHRGVTRLLINDKWLTFITSSALRLETIIFDRGGRFIPGEYDLQPVPLSLIIRKHKRSPSKGMSPKEARHARKRMVIPGVRGRAAINPDEEK